MVSSATRSRDPEPVTRPCLGGVRSNARPLARAVAVFGHAIWLNAVAYALATAAGLSDEQLDSVLDMDLHEAEAVLVPVYGGKIQHMVVPL